MPTGTDPTGGRSDLRSTPLVLDGVRRRFGRRDAVRSVSLRIPAGEVHLLVGPNGSGKSTIARMAVGLLRPNAGLVRVGDRDPARDATARRGIGFAGHQSQLYDDLTPRENLEFVARLYGLAGPAEAVTRQLDRFQVGTEREAPVRRLSRGMVQRVALARALLIQPTLLVLDEPFTGLDAESADRLLGVLSSVRSAGAAVLVISHELELAWRLPARVTVLRAGEVALETDTAATPLDPFRGAYAEAVRG